MQLGDRSRFIIEGFIFEHNPLQKRHLISIISITHYQLCQLLRCSIVNLFNQVAPISSHELVFPAGPGRFGFF